MGWLEDSGRFLSGGVDPNTTRRLAGQVQGPDQGNYQIAGLGDYQSTMQGLAGSVPGAQDYQGANADQTAQQTALQQYFQNVGLGKQNTAADQMFQNAQAQAGSQMQSAMVSAGGMNPALAQRQIANSQAATQGQLASKSATQKYQEQQQGAQFAQQGSQALVQQRMAEMQQNYAEQMQGIQAKKDIANGIFGANRAQTSLNSEYDQNRQAYQQFQYQQQMQAERDQAQQRGAMIRMMMQAGVSLGGAALGGGMFGAGGTFGQAIAGGAANGLAQGLTSRMGAPMVSGRGDSGGYMQGGPQMGLPASSPAPSPGDATGYGTGNG